MNSKKNVLLTSSFTSYANYMRPLGELIKGGEAMKKFGNTMVVWDLKAIKPTKVLAVRGAPLEIRWSLNPKDNWALTAAALTSKLWLVKQDGTGEWIAKEVGTIGDLSKIPLPADISITREGKGLWVNTFMDGTTRYFDLSNPEAPKQTYEKATGKQVNMISQSWDGKRGSSPRRCSRTGTRAAQTTSSSCAASRGTARSWRRSSRLILPTSSSAGRIT